MGQPIDIADSWALAERAAFEHLLGATGSTEGKNAFLGALPEGSFDVWMLTSGGGDAQTLWQDTPTDMLTTVRVEGVFRERSGAQRLTMMIVAALPLRSKLNIQCLRIAEGGFPEPVPDRMALANDAAPGRRVWRAEIGMEMAFRLRQEVG